MAKVLRPVLMVAAIVLPLIPGLGVVAAIGLKIGLGLLLGAAAGIGASLLASASKAPKVSPATTNRLNADIDPRTARKGVWGHTAMNTDIRDEEYTGTDKEYLHRFIVTASHKLTAYAAVWFDDKLAWTLGGGVQGEFVGYLTVDPILEGSAANAINISSRMGSSRRYTGCGYIHFRFKLTGNTKKAESPFAASVPTRITIVGDGMPVYDPRYDSTVAGGSGSARANDQTTWQYSYSGSASGRNPACQAVTYLLGWRIQNPVTSAWKLAVGKGVPAERIDLPSFITGANLCDESVTLAVGGTEPRYRSDGVFSEFDQATDVLDNLKAAMSGELDDMDGQIRLTVLHNDLGSPVLDITDDDVLGEFQWTPFASLENSRNVVRGNYVDSSDASLYQMVPYPDVAIASPDGIERAEPVNYQFVQSMSQAQRLSKQRLQRAQYAGIFQAQFKSRLWRGVKGDVTTFTFGPTGFAEKLFRITDSDVAVNGVVSVLLREEHANIYLWDADESPAVVPVDNSPFTNLDLPFVQALQDLETLGIVGYLTNEAHTVPASSGGVVSSYAGASGAFVVLQGGADISDQFTLATKSGGNSQNLTVTYTNSVNPRTYSVTGAGTGGGEFGNASVDGAALTIRATGSGAFAGIIIDKVFSIAKSRAGATGSPGTDGTDGSDGANAKLMTILSDRQTIAYDGAGSPSPTTQTTTFTAQKQNTSATVNWSITDASGAARTPTTTYLSAATGDSVTMTEGQFAAARNGTSGVIVTGSLTDGSTITDKISVTKVQAGAAGSPGTDGTDGADGASAITATAAPPIVLVPSSPSGSPTGAVPGFAFTVYRGATNITATATGTSYTVSGSADVSGITHVGDGVFTVTGMTADTGYVEVTVTNGTTAIVRIPYAKVLAGSPANAAVPTHVAFLNDASGYAVIATLADIAVTDGATLSADANVIFDVSGGYSYEYKLTYQNITDAGGETDFSGSEITDFANFAGNPWSLVTSGTWVNSLGHTAVVRVRLYQQRLSGTHVTSGVDGYLNGHT